MKSKPPEVIWLPESFPLQNDILEKLEKTLEEGLELVRELRKSLPDDALIAGFRLVGP